MVLPVRQSVGRGVRQPADSLGRVVKTLPYLCGLCVSAVREDW
jgi:hypothetical protein